MTNHNESPYSNKFPLTNKNVFITPPPVSPLVERYFEYISEILPRVSYDYHDPSYSLPCRATQSSAGYDFYAPREITIAPGEIVKIETGVRAAFPKNEFLAIYIRSSLGGTKPGKELRIVNGTGIVDSDYYGNPVNEGHIFVFLKNDGNQNVTIGKNERFVQGIFQQYFTVQDDVPTSEARKGGHGSTGL